MKYLNFLLSLVMPGLWMYAFIKFPDEDVSVGAIMGIFLVTFIIHIIALVVLFKRFKEEYQRAVFWMGVISTILFFILMFLKHSFLLVGIFAVVTLFFYICYVLISTEELLKDLFKKNRHQKEVHDKWENK